MNLADRIAEIEQTSNLRALDVTAGKGSFIALTQAEWRAVKEVVAALMAQTEAERMDEEYQDLVAQSDAEGWDEQTGGSHLTSAWSPVAAAYERARELRRAALPTPPKA